MGIDPNSDKSIAVATAGKAASVSEAVQEGGEYRSNYSG